MSNKRSPSQTSKYSRQRYAADSDYRAAKIARAKKWYAENKERKKEYDRKYREKNKERHRQARKMYYAANRDQRLRSSRAWVLANREASLEYHRNYYVTYYPKMARHIQTKQREKLYGLTPADFERLLAQQNGGCAICGHPHDYALNTFKGLSVDHCHATGRVRGLLCRVCNLGLGHFRDDLAKLQRAVEYLQRPPFEDLK